MQATFGPCPTRPAPPQQPEDWDPEFDRYLFDRDGIQWLNALEMNNLLRWKLRELLAAGVLCLGAAMDLSSLEAMLCPPPTSNGEPAPLADWLVEALTAGRSTLMAVSDNLHWR